MARRPGDPSPRSAFDLHGDRGYRFVEADRVGVMVRIVFMHCGTDTHWMTYYADDQDPAQWFQVKRVVVKRFEYVRVAP